MATSEELLLEGADRDAVKKFRALGNALRLSIYTLASGQSVNDLAIMFGRSQPQMSHELNVLEDAGLISRTREGCQTRIYRIAEVEAPIHVEGIEEDEHT